MIEIVQAVSPGNIAHARTLLQEYATALNFDLCFQSFDAELANLPGDYAPPSGRLLLAYINDEPAGCIALHAWSDSTKVLPHPSRSDSVLERQGGNNNTGECGASAVQREPRARAKWLATEPSNKCEMKRLYVRPQARGHNLGRHLIDRILAEARSIGYTHMRLDTIRGTMDHAIALYREYGFCEIPPYRPNPQAGVLYLELDLSS